jgi:hypothetical protein
MDHAAKGVNYGNAQQKDERATDNDKNASEASPTIEKQNGQYRYRAVHCGLRCCQNSRLQCQQRLYTVEAQAFHNQNPKQRNEHC